MVIREFASRHGIASTAKILLTYCDWEERQHTLARPGDICHAAGIRRFPRIRKNSNSDPGCNGSPGIPKLGSHGGAATFILSATGVGTVRDPQLVTEYSATSPTPGTPQHLSRRATDHSASVLLRARATA